MATLNQEESEWLQHSMECAPWWVLARAAIGLALITLWSGSSLPESLSIHPYAISAYVGR